MDVVLTGFLALKPKDEAYSEGTSPPVGLEYGWEGHWYFKGSKSRTNGFTYKVRFHRPGDSTRGVDLGLAQSEWGSWRQQETGGPCAPSAAATAPTVTKAPSSSVSAAASDIPPAPEAAATSSTVPETTAKPVEEESSDPEDRLNEATGEQEGAKEKKGDGDAISMEQEEDMKQEGVGEGEKDSSASVEPEDDDEGGVESESGAVKPVPAPSTAASPLSVSDASRGVKRPLCPNPLGSLSASGFFTVHSTTPATHIEEEFVLKMGDSISAAGQISIEGEGTNIYGQFTLRGTLTLPLNRLILHRRYKSERKPRKARPKAEAPPVSVPLERRASHRITFGVRKRPLFADQEDEDGSGDLPVAASGSCPAAKLLAVARMIRRKMISKGFERWVKVLPHLPPVTKRIRMSSKGGPEPRIVQGGKGSQQLATAVTAQVQRSAHQFEPKFRPTPTWVHAFLDEEGEIYEGEMSDGWRHGMGVCMYPNGFMYEGNWKRGKEHGKGKLLTPEKKLIYEGEWVDGKMHGKGTYHFKSGGWYEGDWKENLRHGNGTYHLPESAGVYKGEWKDDLRSGFGVLTWANGAVYEGDWARGVRQGRGTLRWHDGFYYHGQWAQNEMDGRGSCDYPDNERYEGMWKQGVKEGRGALKFPNGANYEGRFRDDMIDGQGTIEIKHPVEDGNPGDWMIPLDIQVDVGRAHRKAGFDKEGF